MIYLHKKAFTSLNKSLMRDIIAVYYLLLKEENQ